MRRDMLLGSEAIAEGVRLAKPAVIPAYPITPQTHIIEVISEMVDHGELNAKYIKVESELSAAAAALGSATAGVRTFTATSSHGLALMHELLHWIPASRVPLVMVNANRAIGAPWNIWTDQGDSMTQRDLGWLQIYCANSQEALDTILQAYYITEKILLPVMVMIDGFILSHTMEPVEIPDEETVDKFLPEYKPEIYLTPEQPYTFNAAAKGDIYYSLRKDMEDTLENSFETIEECHIRFFKYFNRKYELIHTYNLENADTVFVVCGALEGTIKVAIDKLKERGINIGLVRLRYFRPFPKKELREILKNKKNILVLNKSISFGAAGHITQEIKNALYGFENDLSIFDIIASLGGKDIFPETLINIVENIPKYRENLDKPIWIE
jgi:pyruvate ferredoxin oxidoreductase alpha subunit